MSQTTFANKVGISKGWPSNMMSGRQKPPNDAAILMEWGRVLELNVKETDVFIELALLEHTPERIRVRYLEMKRRRGKKPVV